MEIDETAMRATWTDVPTVHIAFGGAGGEAAGRPRRDAVIEETPVALSYNGVAHAVMMASPEDIADFALGFSLTEGIAADPADVRAIRVAAAEQGMEVDITLAAAAFSAFLKRHRRTVVGRTGCGVCGVEEIGEAFRPLPPVPAGAVLSRRAIARALDALDATQALNRQTHAAHAAAWADETGNLVAVREDVGRHNALDKLIGALVRAGTGRAHGFCLITSRCSYEMAQKAVAAGMPALVAISAPTGLAIRTAEAAGLTLIAFARAEGLTVYAGAERLEPVAAIP